VLTVGSLFSGIGGLDLGLERAGIVVRWQVEIDEWCRRVLAKHWPDVERFADVRECGKHNLAPVDLICGGFPCQDISFAGKGAGIDGERSGLWCEFARIVRELRPRYVLVENVSALLVRGMGRVLGDLAACGYDAEWDCIPAAAVGAPHRRDRVFVVANSQRDGFSKYPGWQSCRTNEKGRVPESEPSCASLANATGRGCGTRRARGTSTYGERREGATRNAIDDDGPRQPGIQGQRSPTGAYRSTFLGADQSGFAEFVWRPEPDVGRVADGVPSRVDRLRGLGNAVVPQVAEWIGRRIVAAAGKR